MKSGAKWDHDPKTLAAFGWSNSHSVKDAEKKDRKQKQTLFLFFRGSLRAESLWETEKSRRVERNMWNRKDGAGICVCVWVWFWLCGLFVGRSVKSLRQRHFSSSCVQHQCAAESPDCWTPRLQQVRPVFTVFCAVGSVRTDEFCFCF